jgi:hypothetical protein
MHLRVGGRRRATSTTTTRRWWALTSGGRRVREEAFSNKWKNVEMAPVPARSMEQLREGLATGLMRR